MRIFVIVLAISLFLGLLVAMAVALARVREQPERDDEGSAQWDVIEPAQLENGTTVSAEMSRRRKARQVLSGRVYGDAERQARAGARVGLLIMGAIVLLAALVLAPTFLVMLR